MIWYTGTPISRFINENAYKDIVFGIFAKDDILNYYGNVEIEKGKMILTTGITKEGTLEFVANSLI